MKTKPVTTYCSTDPPKTQDIFCNKCTKAIPAGAVFCPWCGKKQISTPRRRRKRANGTGTIFKLTGNRRRPWAVQKNGVYIGYYETEKAAQEALERLAGSNPSDSYNLTFAEVYERWKPGHFKKISTETAKAYEYSFELFKDLHNIKFRDLKTSDFQNALDSVSVGKSESCVQKRKQLLTQMSTWAVKERIIPTNYASFCDAAGKAATHHQPLTDVEIAKIERDGSETARIILMLLATGMRINELFTLRLCDYYGEYCIGGEKSEAGRNRIIPIRPEGRPHFEYFAEKATAAGGALLIDGYKGNKEANNFRSRDYSKLIKRLGIDPSKTPHSTRTTYGTRAATDDNLAPATLGKIMGHSDFSTTQKFYNSPSPDQLVKAVEKSVSNK